MKILWNYTRLGVVLLSILIFTPVVIPQNDYKPELLGLPYTLWTGVVAYFAYVILILLGIRAHSRINKEGDGHD